MMVAIEEPSTCEDCGGKIAVVDGVAVELDRDGVSIDVEHECGFEANVAYR